MEILPVTPEELQHIMSDETIVDNSSNVMDRHRSYEQKSSAFLEYATTAAHFCSAFYMLFVLYLCFTNEFVFFTWHPVLLSIGWMFLMTEAILTFSNENIVVKYLGRVTRIKYHWVLQTIAGSLIAIGFLIVYVNKNLLNKQHFKTWHAFFGLVALICCVPTCLNGILALFRIDLKNVIKPRNTKILHIVSGITTYFFGAISLSLSVFSHWFERNTNQSNIIFNLCFLAVMFSVVVTLIKPVVNFFRFVLPTKS